MKKLRVLVACEYSGRVRDAFLAKGHDAMSCDLLPTDSPGPHYQGDVVDVLYQDWDMVISHPPCTYLTCAAEWAYAEVPMIKGKPRKIKKGTLVGAAREKARIEALEFVELIWKSPAKKKVLENPVGVIPARLAFMPKPQYIQQYNFGEDASKTTGLYLDGVEPLEGTRFVDPRMVCKCGYTFSYELGKHGCPNCNGEFKALPRWGNQTDSGQNKEPPSKTRWKNRSDTPIGIANAMADQWG